MESQLQRANAELRRAREQLARYGESLIAIHRAILPQRLPDVPGLDLAVHFAEAEGPVATSMTCCPSDPSAGPLSLRM